MSKSGSRERWQLPFAILMALLFALFVILNAQSRMDAQKSKALLESLRQAFSAGVDAPPIAGGGKAVHQPFENTETSAAQAPHQPPAAAEGVVALDALGGTLMESLADDSSANGSGSPDRVKWSTELAGLMKVRISAERQFKAGRSDLEPDLVPLLDRIGRVLMSSGKFVRIEGHSDEEDQDSYPISLKRAEAVSAHWIKTLHFPPEKISIAAYSKFRPLDEDPNKTGLNRRVEFYISEK